MSTSRARPRFSKLPKVPLLWAEHPATSCDTYFYQAHSNQSDYNARYQRGDYFTGIF